MMTVAYESGRAANKSRARTSTVSLTILKPPGYNQHAHNSPHRQQANQTLQEASSIIVNTNHL